MSAVKISETASMQKENKSPSSHHFLLSSYVRFPEQYLYFSLEYDIALSMLACIF